MTAEKPTQAGEGTYPKSGAEPGQRSVDVELSDTTESPGYSIAAVSKLTGISCHTLRVWERRYGFPVPRRSPAGHRRYSRGQVQTLCHLTHLIRVSRLPIGELMIKWKAGDPAFGSGPPQNGTQAVEEPSARLVNRLAAGDLAGANASTIPWHLGSTREDCWSWSSAPA